MKTSNKTSATWFAYRQPRPQARVRIFCFPYAGGSAAIYRNWFELLPPEIDIWPLQLPGRETRLSEQSIDQMSQLITAVMPILVPHLDELPFAFFGHSMGAHICFEMTRALRLQHHSLPSHLFVSGSGAPQLPAKHSLTHTLSDHDFIERLRFLNGTPSELLENAEFLQLVLPTLRADFKLIETYSYLPMTPLPCPITVFGGLEDQEVSRNDLLSWKQHTHHSFKIYMLPGDHFFLHTEKTILLQTLVRELLSLY